MLGVIGDVVQDVVVWQLEPVQRATDTRSSIVTQRGGSAANVAALAAPRYRTRFLGCVGDDAGGHSVRRDLEEHGVDVRVQVRDRTGVIVVLIDETGERTMFPSRGASARMRRVDPTWLDGIELLHITAYSFESRATTDAVLAATREIKERGGRISLDVSSIGTIEHRGVPGFLDLMQRCEPDFISANRDESLLLDLADGSTPGAGLKRFPGAVLLARAGTSETNVIQDGEHLLTVPVQPVSTARDLTGAGDAFNAGFLANYLAEGWDPPRNVEAAHAMSRRVLHNPGCGDAVDERLPKSPRSEETE